MNAHNIGQMAQRQVDAWRAKNAVILERMYDPSYRVGFGKMIVERYKNTYGEAGAQLLALQLARRCRDKFLPDFAEMMIEKLISRVDPFGERAYPLTEKQFESALSAEWR